MNKRFSITIILTLIFFLSPTIGQENKMRFRSITLEDGLSQSSVDKVYQDSYGYIWLATRNGLNRFNGHSIKTYNKSDKANEGLSDIIITDITEDNSKTLWIGTQNGGLNKFDRVNEKFKSYPSADFNTHGLSSDYISCLHYSSQNKLWIGTDKGLFVYHRDKELFTLYSFISNNNERYVRNYIHDIVEDRLGNIWVGTNNGLYIIDSKDISSCHYLPEFFINNTSLINIPGITEDSDRNIWLGTEKGIIQIEKGNFQNMNYHYYPLVTVNNKGSEISSIQAGIKVDKDLIYIGTKGNGLIRFNTKTKKTSTIKATKTGLLNNYISCLTYDRTGVLWIGSEGGVNLYDKYMFKFDLYKQLPYSESDIALNNLHTIQKDRNSVLWLGSKSDGIFIIDENNKRARQITQMNSNKQLLSDKIRCMLIDSHHQIWIGYHDLGLALLSQKGNLDYSIKNYYNDNTAPAGLQTGKINSIIEGKNGDIWIGSENGFYQYTPDSKQFRKYNLFKNSEHQKDKVYRIYEASNSNLYISTEQEGLFIYDYNEGLFTQHTHHPDDSLSLPSNTVANIFIDSKDRTWISIFGHGIIQFDLTKGKIIPFEREVSFPNDVIYEIFEDLNGKLWMSSDNGIFSFNPENLEINKFNISDGLQSNEFNGGASYQSPTGELYFGGKFGFNKFRPEAIKHNPYEPKLSFTDFKILGELVKPNDKFEILEDLISDTEAITLKHNHNLIEISFSAMSYSGFEKNKYSYKLEGFMDNWIGLENSNKVSFSNLSRGAYNLLVKASNNDGLECEPISLKITVLPSPWKSWWAYSIYIIIIAILLMVFIRNTNSRLTLINDLKLAELEKQKSIELNELKLKFFTNISHEFRTPLTLILGPIDDLISKGRFTLHEMEQLKTIKKNAEYFLQLLNRLMTFRKLEKGKMRLRVNQGNLNQVIANCADSFKNVAQNRAIDFKIIYDNKNVQAWFDHEKIEMLIYNLLSNAFKYSENNSVITIRMRLFTKKNRAIKYICDPIDDLQNGLMAEIEISDTGMGIPKEKQKFIFERFSQLDSSVNQEYSNSIGIGLSLVQDIIKLHKGSIGLQSQPGSGSVFTARFPISKNNYTANEISEEKEIKTSIPITPNQYISIPENLTKDSELDIYEDKEKVFPERSVLPNLLIVEDNNELRDFLCHSFQENYQITASRNGAEAWKIIKDKNPDIIVSDLMMPEMDGFELCKKIRSEIGNHIPIILLTAKTMADDQYKGIAMGADAYITKPFSFRYLDLRVKKLLESRLMLKEYFRLSEEIESDKLNLTSADEQFLHKVMEVIEENISNSEFNVSELADKMAMSRSHLYRKLNTLTGQIPKDFMKSVRLNHAAKLLKKKKYSISDISYHVGFSDPKYFSKCFRKRFGVSPTAYSEK